MSQTTTFSSADQGGSRLFVAGIVMILVLGVAGIGFLALNRDTNLDEAPLSNQDHWHMALRVQNCEEELLPTSEFTNPAGLHTHEGDSLIHAHPFSPAVSGRNATLGNYFSASGYEGKLTDAELETGLTDRVYNRLSEEVGCGGNPAQLTAAVWEDPFDANEEPTIYTEGLADIKVINGGAVTVALLEDGQEVPKPSQTVLDSLASASGDLGIDPSLLNPELLNSDGGATVSADPTKTTAADNDSVSTVAGDVDASSTTEAEDSASTEPGDVTQPTASAADTETSS